MGLGEGGGGGRESVCGPNERKGESAVTKRERENERERVCVENILKDQANERPRERERKRER